METLTDVWPATTFLVLYTSALFGAFWWMLKSQISHTKDTLKAQISNTHNTLQAQISNTNDTLKSIKDLLTNHISDTNKKIDQLNERFDRLYELLLQEKGKKQHGS